MPWEDICYEILDYELKFLQIKLPLFIEMYTHISKAILLISDWKKYTSNSISLLSITK